MPEKKEIQIYVAIEVKKIWKYKVIGNGIMYKLIVGTRTFTLWGAGASVFSHVKWGDDGV